MQINIFANRSLPILFSYIFVTQNLYLFTLGDSGYPQETHLHVPYNRASPGSQEDEYNAAHSRGRCIIERCNGALKNRFRCLLKHRTLHYCPEAACRIINSCIILHNMCVEGEITWEEFELPEEDQLFDTTE